ncbi:hypothetical protein D3C86_1614980 [compost metagenome]
MRPTLLSNFLLQAREASFRSQYQPVVRYMFWVVFRPSAWMSLMNTSKPAIFMVCVTPNSFAALTELLKSPPALARPRICALEAWACSRNEEKSAVPSGARTWPLMSPPASLTTFMVSRSSAWPKA